MVIPWIGFPLADFVKKCEPTPAAEFIEFTTLYDPEQMPFQKMKILQWPYVEGLRKTLIFNGYEDEVSSLYAKMNLRRPLSPLLPGHGEKVE